MVNCCNYPYVLKCDRKNCRWNLGVFVECTMVRKGWFHCIWISLVILVLVLVYFVLEEAGIKL